MASRGPIAKRLARLEGAYADQLKRMQRERLTAKVGKWTHEERRARIVFLMRHRMQACGITPTLDENLADAAVRTLYTLWPSVGYLAPTLRQIFDESEGLPPSAATAEDTCELVGEAPPA